MTFGDWIKGKRTELGLSQERLAQAASVDRAYVNKLERGKIGLPLVDTRARFHKALGTTEDELIALGIVRNDAYAIIQTGVIRASGQPVRATGAGPIIDEFVSLMRQVEWDYRAEEAMRGILEGLIRSSGTATADDPPSPDPAES